MIYEGVAIQTCDGCGGEFVAPASILRIVQTREVVFGEKFRALFADHQPVFGIPAGQTERKLHCPGCNGPMRLLNFAVDTGVCVDRCDACGGIWLDNQELEKLQIIIEIFQDRLPEQLKAISFKLEDARHRAAASCRKCFRGSRFAFVNAMLNRLLDAA
jgi:Zn-finger nucleic acid-binding protein